MTKNIDSDPDINQLQFILYQYARQGSTDRRVGSLRPSHPARAAKLWIPDVRACHIVEKTKNLESDLDEFNIKDFVYRKRDFLTMSQIN